MKKVLFIVSAFFFFLIPSSVFANSLDYTITKYDIDITVNENNILDIKENITVNFTKPRHGIYRYIPLTNYIERTDGTKTTVKAKVKKVRVNKSFDTYTENGNKVIQIGSADYKVTGENDYVVEYSYDLGKDKNENFDELYYNIIGIGWKTTLSNVTFTIHMPKDYNQEKFGISTGAYGLSGSDDVKVEFIGNDIKGTVLRTLNGGEAVTTRIELEEGYFVRPLFTKADYIVIIIPLILAGIGLYLWRKHGVDAPIIETVEFYPPDNFNSAELGYIYKNRAEDKDVVSLLIYLANKGYIKVEEGEKNKKFTLTKLKDYDGDNAIERQFLEGLFKTKEVVKESDLSEKFYTTISSIKFKLGALRSKIYLKKSDNKRWIIALLIFLANAVTGGYFIYREVESISELLEINYLCIGISAIISIVLLIISFIYIPKRTPYGTEIIGKIRGFRNFLETAEKPKLEELVMQDPKYFYNILPYTYVLGVSDKWIKKFESIAVAPPEWYGSNVSTFDMIYFSRFMNRTMTNATRVMTSIPAPQSSGGWSGSSGGGFSGGGSGGGGGGAW